ncbi:hypothetical protein ACN6LF_001858 [[Kitasatospora] papulosa]|uniref:hypothetical protein n=1 Tax=Streptomyces TaxID=1883 RepID=UPI0029A96B56|nr:MULTISPECIES: hypothetical protein [unclassified Streptomyces]MDX3183494.1 hypothetical protein [Streptomyces sp. ME02-7008A-1]MDX3303946.1 hypothetical protein [Streptomyces sp. ME02-7008A]WSZ51159.1 hypothetical protein OG337_29045 [[Kitasatospora] papulosa]
MPRTAVPYTQFVPNGSLADPAGTTIDSTLVTNGVVINNADPERTLIRVTNTAGTDKVVTVKAGTGTQSWMGGQGDSATTVAATSGKQFIGPFTSARFQQKGTKLFVDFASGTTGTITVFKLPKAY